MFFKNFHKPVNTFLFKLQKIHFSNSTMGVPLTDFIKTIQEIAPLKLAESWDNVGLLVEPHENLNVKKLLLTIDLTENVVEEAAAVKADLIVSYHPNIFKPLKSVTQKHWKERIITKCISRNIAVFSPHTTWDAMQNGVNDWLGSVFDINTSRPILPNAEQNNVGMGRLISLKTPIILSKAIENVKNHIGIAHLRVAVARNKNLDHEISTVALCAGSGAGVLNGIKADLYLTGEMLHHDVLEATQKDTSVILCNHTDSERGFLTVFKEKFKFENVEVIVSKVDKDCITIY